MGNKIVWKKEELVKFGDLEVGDIFAQGISPKMVYMVTFPSKTKKDPTHFNAVDLEYGSVVCLDNDELVKPLKITITVE